jgi:hypothetical protein
LGNVGVRHYARIGELVLVSGGLLGRGKGLMTHSRCSSRRRRQRRDMGRPRLTAEASSLALAGEAEPIDPGERISSMVGSTSTIEYGIAGANTFRVIAVDSSGNASPPSEITVQLTTC